MGLAWWRELQDEETKGRDEGRGQEHEPAYGESDQAYRCAGEDC